jgi:hypothetical protein
VAAGEHRRVADGRGQPELITASEKDSRRVLENRHRPRRLRISSRFDLELIEVANAE